MSEVKVRFNQAVEGWEAGAVVVVEETRRVQNMARRGFVTIMERIADARPEVPARNASRGSWVEYVQSLGLPVWAGARRGDIIADVEALEAGERTTVIGWDVPEDSREPEGGLDGVVGDVDGSSGDEGVVA